MNILTIILDTIRIIFRSIFLNRWVMITLDALLALWILHSYAGIGFGWLVVISVALLSLAVWFFSRREGRIGAFFRRFRIFSENANASENGGTDWSDPESIISEDDASPASENDVSPAETAASQDDSAYDAGPDDGAAPAGISENVPGGMNAAGKWQLAALNALFIGLSCVALKDVWVSSPQATVVRTEAELMGIKTIEKLYTGFSYIDMEDLHYGESLFSGRYLDGLCIRKYQISYGYQNIGKYLDDDKVMEAVCRGNTADLPKPEIMAANSLTMEQEGNYTVSGECHKWDENQQYRNMKLLGFMNQHGLLNVKDSQDQLRTYLRPACETIFARKAEAQALELQDGSQDNQKQ